MAKKRKIAGIVFNKQMATTKGRDAERYARELREDGFLAKIIEENIGGSTLYVVYSHKAEARSNPLGSVTSKSPRITPKTPKLRR